jgi:Family of unknown function (DUF6335)
MAKRSRGKATRRAKATTKGRKRPMARRAKPVKRAASKRARRAAPKKSAAKRPSAHAKSARKAAAPPRSAVSTAAPRLNRTRRVLAEEDNTLRTPPSSLDMDRHGSAARSGRKGLEANIRKHNDMSPALTGGDVDADWENAYFSGDEAPGGDNLTPDQEDVDDMGKALGVQYQDNEELQGSEKVIQRDQHRWELDPASSDDYKDRT